MILFDTSVILDLRDETSRWCQWAREQVATAGSGEGAMINPIVLAEASIRASDRAAVQTELEAWGIQLAPLPVESASPAAAAYAVYLDRLKTEGKTGPRTPLPDFFIGAHAQAQSLTVCTRDPARLATYFPSVGRIEP